MVRATKTPVKLSKFEAQKIMANVPEEKIFWSHDGQIFRNIIELAKGLVVMTDETYAYHANTYKNDFVNWVKDIIGDEQMARDLSKSMSRQDAARKIDARVNYLASER